jgi:hypothetical protein
MQMASSKTGRQSAGRNHEKATLAATASERFKLSDIRVQKSLELRL